MNRLTLVAACCATLPVAALADAHDTRIPEAAWETQFTGRYAPDDACDDEDRLWVLSPLSVRMGPVECIGMGKLTWQDDGLIVPLSQCREGPQEHADITLAFSRMLDGGLEVTQVEGAAMDPVRLDRCPLE